MIIIYKNIMNKVKIYKVKKYNYKKYKSDFSLLSFFYEIINFIFGLF